MNVFMVVISGMGATSSGRVFKDKASAEALARSLEGKATSRVVCAPVFGECEKPGFVYAAEFYDATQDIHHLEGLYGSYQAAKEAAGEGGLALERPIEA